MSKKAKVNIAKQQELFDEKLSLTPPKPTAKRATEKRGAQQPQPQLFVETQLVLRG